MLNKSLSQARPEERYVSADPGPASRVDLTIVIPVYNEAENLPRLCGEVVGSLKKTNFTYEILFIDDGSTDGSFGLLCDMCGRYGHLRVVRFNRNYGQSAALNAGFRLAGGEYVITMDGDLQNDPADIGRLLDKMSEGYDVVCGWRASRKDSPGKKIFSRISNAIRSALVGETIHDSGCTLRAYRGECVKDVEVLGEMHRYIPALMSFHGYRVGEIKVNHRERAHGTSKYGWRRLMKGSSDLLAVAFWNRFATRPMHIFGVTGMLIGAMGLLTLAYLVSDRVLFNSPLSNRPLFILAILATIVGLQFIALGILADISLKIYYDLKGAKNYRIEKVVISSPSMV